MIIILHWQIIASSLTPAREVSLDFVLELNNIDPRHLALRVA
jgi:hypothetical protein